VLFRVREGKVDRFRCHTGHGFTTQALAEELVHTSEAALWHAVQTLEEHAALLSETAARLALAGDAASANVLGSQSREIEQRLHVLRSLALARETKPDDELTGSG
jgi:two-component system chemotaxis response regulator CheB